MVAAVLAACSSPGAPAAPDAALDQVIVTGERSPPDSASQGIVSGEALEARPLSRTGEVLVEDNGLKSSATSLVNARVGYAFDRRLRVHLDVFNLLNRRDSDIDYFYVSRLPGEPAAGVADVHFHPVEPRSFRVTLSADLP